MIFQRDVDAIESDEQIMKDLDLIRKTQEQTKQYIDSINSRLKHYKLVLQPKPKQKKQPKFEEEV